MAILSVPRAQLPGVQHSTGLCPSLESKDQEVELGPQGRAESKELCTCPHAQQGQLGAHRLPCTTTQLHQKACQGQAYRRTWADLLCGKEGSWAVY